MASNSEPAPNRLDHTTDIVTAFLSFNPLAPAALGPLIARVHDALTSLDERAAPIPAVPIAASVKPDYLVCLEDGARLKLLKRHLLRQHGFTIAAYRTRWGLPDDYPSVAPRYAERRRTLAKEFGLGRRTGVQVH